MRNDQIKVGTSGYHLTLVSWTAVVREGTIHSKHFSFLAQIQTVERGQALLESRATLCVRTKNKTLQDATSPGHSVCDFDRTVMFPHNGSTD